MCAKSTLPFGGASATKSIGKSLTFYRRGNRQKVKSYGVPTGNPSEAQLSQQAYIRSKVAAWQALSASEKAKWNTRAKARGNPWYGYTLFMSTYVGGLSFTDLLDALSSYAGESEKIIRIKSDESGLEAAEPSHVFLDNFDDEELHWTWRTDETLPLKTIVESGGVLTFTIPSGWWSDWWSSANSALKTITGIPGYPFEIITKINTHDGSGSKQSGIYVGDEAIEISANHVIYYAHYHSGLVIATTGSSINTGGVVDLPIWLRIRVLSRTYGIWGNSLIFSYSTDGETWTDQYTYNGFNIRAQVCGLFVKTWSECPACSIPFEFFKITAFKGPG